jgi:hypothetical protein
MAYGKNVTLTDLLAALRTQHPASMRSSLAVPAGNSSMTPEQLRRHNEKRYRENGWRQGKDGNWYPPRAVPYVSGHSRVRA